MVENCLETAVMDLENGFREHLVPAIINGAVAGFLWILVGSRHDLNICFPQLHTTYNYSRNFFIQFLWWHLL